MEYIFYILDKIIQLIFDSIKAFIIRRNLLNSCPKCQRIFAIQMGKVQISKRIGPIYNLKNGSRIDEQEFPLYYRTSHCKCRYCEYQYIIDWDS